LSSLTVVAITHHRAAFDLFERVALDVESSRTLAAALVPATATESVVLSTCNRTEIYLAGDPPDAGAALAALAAHTGVPLAELAPVALTAHGDEASLHLFRVACGLESRVVGEGQILGQVRAAIARAAHDGTAGPQLGALFRFAASAGRRARRGTGVGTTSSLASIALDAAGPALETGTTVVVGAGQMASAVAQELSARRLEYLVCARQPERVTALGHRRMVVGLDCLPTLLEGVELVVCATSARTPLLRADEVSAAMRRRRGRRLTLVDLSIPRNVDPSAAHVRGIRLIDLEGLTAEQGDVHLLHAADVVAAEHERFRMWQAGQAAGALIRHLRTSVYERCRVATAPALPGTVFDAATVDRVARRIAAKLLHGPTITVKELIAAGDEEGARALLRAFGVEQVADEPQPPRDVAALFPRAS
jgi:glutamyl-tRNA reductase